MTVDSEVLRLIDEKLAPIVARLVKLETVVPTPPPPPPPPSPPPPSPPPPVIPPGVKVIYVDVKGNDANDGKTAATAVKTLARAKQLVQAAKA